MRRVSPRPPGPTSATVTTRRRRSCGRWPDATPGVAAVRELCGLTLYRLGNWKAALRELRAFGDLTGSADQLPVVADCERALGRHARVAEIWSELRSAGAGSDVLAEGRLVMAGSLADRGRIDEAIALLGRRPRATCAARTSGTCGSGTCSPTSTSAAGTCPGPASSSNGS